MVLEDSQEKTSKKPLAEILVATNNQGKIREFAELLKHLPICWRGLDEFPNVTEVAETGATFAENAALKAVGYAAQTGLPTIADDSGLEVAALGGAPGVFSARFGGTWLSDAERAEKLLVELEKAADKKKIARFICVIVFADKNGKIYHTASGICNGQIAPNLSGSNGFGYDPIFIPSGFEQTFGELPAEIKRKISHRARAVDEITRFLQHFLQIYS